MEQNSLSPYSCRTVVVADDSQSQSPTNPPVPPTEWLEDVLDLEIARGDALRAARERAQNLPNSIAMDATNAAWFLGNRVRVRTYLREFDKKLTDDKVERIVSWVADPETFHSPVQDDVYEFEREVFASLRSATATLRAEFENEGETQPADEAGAQAEMRIAAALSDVRSWAARNQRRLWSFLTTRFPDLQPSDFIDFVASACWRSAADPTHYIHPRRQFFLAWKCGTMKSDGGKLTWWGRQLPWMMRYLRTQHPRLDEALVLDRAFAVFQKTADLAHPGIKTFVKKVLWQSATKEHKIKSRHPEVSVDAQEWTELASSEPGPREIIMGREEARAEVESSEENQLRLWKNLEHLDRLAGDQLWQSQVEGIPYKAMAIEFSPPDDSKAKRPTAGGIRKAVSRTLRILRAMMEVEQLNASPAAARLVDAAMKELGEDDRVELRLNPAHPAVTRVAALIEFRKLSVAANDPKRRADAMRLDGILATVDSKDSETACRHYSQLDEGERGKRAVLIEQLLDNGKNFGPLIELRTAVQQDRDANVKAVKPGQTVQEVKAVLAWYLPPAREVAANFCLDRGRLPSASDGWGELSKAIRTDQKRFSALRGLIDWRISVLQGFESTATEALSRADEKFRPVLEEMFKGAMIEDACPELHRAKKTTIPLREVWHKGDFDAHFKRQQELLPRPPRGFRS